MPQPKTTFTGQDVTEFIHAYVDNAQKKADSFELIELLRQWTGEEPRMWGPSIIGFGTYTYKYASGHGGEAPVLAFSPRKAALTLYVYSHTEKSEALLHDLGQFKMSKACIYVKKTGRHPHRCPPRNLFRVHRLHQRTPRMLVSGAVTKPCAASKKAVN